MLTSHELTLHLVEVNCELKADSIFRMLLASLKLLVNISRMLILSLKDLNTANASKRIEKYFEKF